MITDAAMAVHDRLGQAGGAAGIDDPQRMIERQPLRLERRCRHRRRATVPAPSRSTGQRLQRRVGRTEIAMHDEVLHARQRGAQFLHHVGAVEVLAAVADAVAGDQHLRLDLLEAVEHGGGAHVGRAQAPHAADAGHGEEGDHRLGDVRQVGRDAIAGLHALLLQMQRQRSDLAPQLGPGQLAMHALFVAADDGRQAGRLRRVHMAKHLRARS